MDTGNLPGSKHAVKYYSKMENPVTNHALSKHHKGTLGDGGTTSLNRKPRKINALRVFVLMG
jgi:hypothetical protein